MGHGCNKNSKCSGTSALYMLVIFLITFLLVISFILLYKPDFVTYRDEQGNLQYDSSKVLLYSFIITFVVIIAWILYGLLLLSILYCY